MTGKQRAVCRKIIKQALVLNPSRQVEHLLRYIAQLLTSSGNAKQWNQVFTTITRLAPESLLLDKRILGVCQAVLQANDAGSEKDVESILGAVPAFLAHTENYLTFANLKVGELFCTDDTSLIYRKKSLLEATQCHINASTPTSEVMLPWCAVKHYTGVTIYSQ